LKNKNFYVKEVFNPKDEGKIFGASDQFAIKINRSGVVNETYITTLKKIDAWDKIQLNSVFDYLNVTNTMNFTKLS
jgi:hypothetical protein